MFRAAILIGTAFTLQLGLCRGQDAASCVKVLQVQLENVHSITCRITRDQVTGFSTDSDAGLPVISASVVLRNKIAAKLPDKILPSTVAVEWHEDSTGSFYVQWSQAFYRNDVHAPLCSQTFSDSWDGHNFAESYRLLNRSRSVLTVQKSLPDQIAGLAAEDFLEKPFRFLCPTQADSTMSQFPSLQKLRDGSLFAHFEKVAKSIGIKNILGKQCVAFEIDGGVDAATNEPLFYRVYLNPGDQFFPIGWDQVNGKSLNVKQEYRITEVGKIASAVGSAFRYPKSATTNFYRLTDEGKNQLCAGYITKVDSIALDGNSDFSYSIDPSSVDYILDSGHLINVPK
jgi:hypothetical protein